MPEINYEQAEQTAEKLLRIGSLTFKQIADATGTPLWNVRELYSWMGIERRRVLKNLRGTMLKIGEELRHLTVHDEELQNLFIEYIQWAMIAIYSREVTNEEIDSLRDYICDIDITDIEYFMSKLAVGYNCDTDLNVLGRACSIIDSVYAEMLIAHFDAEKSMPDDVEPDDDEEDEEDDEEDENELDINSQNYIIPNGESEEKDEDVDDEWEV